MFTHCPWAVPSGADVMLNDTKPWAQDESLWNEKDRSFQMVGYQTTAEKKKHSLQVLKLSTRVNDAGASKKGRKGY